MKQIERTGRTNRHGYNGPRITVRRDAHGLTIDVAGKTESIVLDHFDGRTRVFVCDESGNELISHELK